MSGILAQLVVAVLVVLAVGAVAAVFLLPEEGRDPAITRRVRQLAARAPQSGPAGRRAGGGEGWRARGFARGRLVQPLLRLMEQAGVTWRPAQALAAALMIAVLSALILFALMRSLPLALAAGLASGVAGPWIYLRVKRERRFNRCADELPHALDLMARGLRAGRPIGDCIRTVGREAREPVAREFRRIEDEQLLGATLPQAMERMAERLPIDETRFLAIAVSIQSAEGGAFSETLSNLARALRERRRVVRKLTAMSAEHTMSAKLLTVMPVLILFVVSQLNPDYVSVLFTSSAGRILLGVSFAFILAGYLVLSRMTRIEV